MLKQPTKYNKPINVSTEDENAIAISKDDYNSHAETIRLSSNPEQRAKIIEGLNTSLWECLSENDVDW